MKTANNLEDIMVNVKLKLSALWVSVTLCYLYCDYFELYVPEKVEGLINGKNILDSPTKLFAASLLSAIPAVMVFLSIILKPTINKWLNIVVGLLFTAMMILIALTYSEVWYTF